MLLRIETDSLTKKAIESLKSIWGPAGPLGSFSAKINVAYMARIIPGSSFQVKPGLVIGQGTPRERFILAVSDVASAARMVHSRAVKSLNPGYGPGHSGPKHFTPEDWAIIDRQRLEMAYLLASDLFP